MSFSKASFKRFNENAGCAPPVGSYDPKLKDKSVVHGFDKGGDRFKAPKDVTPGPGAFETEVSKKNLNVSICSNGIEKKKIHRSQDNLAEMSKIKDLEREIKKLVLERANQDKVLSQREEEITKLEGKLHSALSDKSSLQAKIASTEKELKEIKKGNEVLKNKITTADNSMKRHESLQSELSSLKHQMESKNKEISRVKHELEITMDHQSCDLQLFLSLVDMLESKAQHLEKDRQNITENNSKRKGSEDSITDRKIVEKLKKRFNEAVLKIEKKIQSYKDDLQEMADSKTLLEESLKLKETELKENIEKTKSLELSRDTLSKQYSSLQNMIKELKTETWDSQDQIRHLKGEIFTKEDCLKEDSQMLFEVRAEKASLLEKLEVLEEENGTLNENIKTLTEKYHVIETRLAEEQNQNNIKSDQIQSQLDVTKCHLMELQDQYQSLLAKNKQLVHSINVEKGSVEKVTYQLDEQTQLSGGLQSLVESKEDHITDLEISLEATKVELQNVIETVEVKEVDILELKDKIKTLEVIESSLKEQLEQEKEMNQLTARQHADRILALEQEEISLKEQLDQVSAEKSDIDRKVTELSKDLQQMLAEKQKSEDQNDELNRALEITKSEGEKKCKQLDTKLHSLNKENTQLMNEIEFLQTSKERLENEMFDKIEKLTVELDQSQNILEEVKARDKELDEEKQELTLKLEKVTSEKEALSKQFTELVTSLQEVRNKSTEKEAEWEADYERLTSELQTVTEERDILKQRISALDQEKSTLNDVIKNLEMKIEDTEQDSKKKIESITSTVETLLANQEELVHESQTLKSVNQTLQSALDNKLDLAQSLENDVEKLTQEMHVYKDYKVKYETKVKEMSSLEDNFQAKVSQIDLLEVKLQDINSGKEMLTQQVTDMDRLVGSLKTEVDRLTEEIDTKDSVIDRMAAQYNTDMNELKCSLISQHGMEMEKLKATLSAQYSQRMDDLRASVDGQYHTEMDKVKASLIDQHNDEINNLKITLSSQHDTEMENLKTTLEGQYEAEMDNLKAANASQAESIDKLSTQINNLEINLKAKESEISEYQKQICDLEQRLDENEKKIVKYLENIGDLERELCQSKELVMEYQEKLGNSDVTACKYQAELSTYQTNINELENKLGQAEEEITMLVDEKEDLARRYEDELDDLRGKVGASDGKDYKQMYEDIMKKVGPFMEQLDQFELERAALLGRSEFAQAELDRLSQAYGKMLGHQNHKQKIKHIQNIKEENNTLKKEITSLREQLLKIKRANTTGKLQKENGVPIPCPLKEGNRK